MVRFPLDADCFDRFLGASWNIPGAFRPRTSRSRPTVRALARLTFSTAAGRWVPKTWLTISRLRCVCI
eukprot:3134962-Pleurochrysis_carterae.AAC.1